jgi:hypothetical protein
MKVTLGLHDFSVVNNRLLWLLTLKDKFPNFRVSLFTVPVDKQEDWGPYRIRNDYLKEIKKNLDWIQIIPHGWKHDKSEISYFSYQMMKDLLFDINAVFTRDGIPYEKGFCAPHWRWNEEVIKALDDMGWWGAVNKRQPTMLKPKRYYEYSHCLDDEWPPGISLKLHGHIFGTDNDIGKNFDKLLALPKDTEWYFVTDFLEGHI